MAQTAAMGPPLSPREPRRSGRRSAPSASTSTSKSPDSDVAPRPKEHQQRQPLTNNIGGGRNRRPKQEDNEDTVDEPKNPPVPSNGTPASTSGNSNGRGKRKNKDKDKQSHATDTLAESSNRKTKVSTAGGEDLSAEAPEEEEEQGITRCVCGSTEDDPDAGEFMVQCETCKVWQHGLCMGYESEDQLHDDDYYCEQCRPELHTELLKKLSKRPRQSSAASHHIPTTGHSRTSRSHSPSYMMKQPSKRRNTMNSRDAAFDESLKEIMEATAAEAAAAIDVNNITSNGHANGHTDHDEDVATGPASRKRRKRPDGEATTKKRTRSASTASDRPLDSAQAHDETPMSSTIRPSEKSSAPAPKNAPRQRRGGGRKNPVHEMPDSEETTHSGKRPGNSRSKSGNTSRRPPASHASHMGGNTNDHSGRRNQASSATGCTGTSNAESSRAYRNSHAYVVSQQPLLTSWHLPDYLAHLEHMLPTNAPRPLEVRSGPGMAGRGESIERTMERGVKVKWPSKRMSVGDMNKRVRALVEWVGREQASALDRGRRREVIEKTLKEASNLLNTQNTDRGINGVEAAVHDISPVKEIPMVQDCPELTELPAQEQPTRREREPSPVAMQVDESAPSTMKMMEELMEELIGFQERFGPGAKNRERERKMMVT